MEFNKYIFCAIFVSVATLFEGAPCSANTYVVNGTASSTQVASASSGGALNFADQWAVIQREGLWLRYLYYFYFPYLYSCDAIYGFSQRDSTKSLIQAYCPLLSPHCSSVVTSLQSTTHCYVFTMASLVATTCSCSLPLPQPPARPPCHVYRGQGPDLRIGNGVSANRCEYPPLVALHHLGADIPFCGGVILDSSTVLTAAHCVTGTCKLEVHAGKYFTSAARDDQLFGKVQKVNSTGCQLHQQYRITTSVLENDIAILKLEQELRFDSCVQPACLPTPGEQPDFTVPCVAMGWGALEFGKEDVPDVLQKASMTGFSYANCKRFFPTQSNLPFGTMCAYYYGFRDTCRGDSGGPLLCRSNTGEYKPFGVVSYGRNCSEPYWPGVYTDLTYHADFLQRYA